MCNAVRKLFSKCQITLVALSILLFAHFPLVTRTYQCQPPVICHLACHYLYSVHLTNPLFTHVLLMPNYNNVFNIYYILSVFVICVCVTLCFKLIVPFYYCEYYITHNHSAISTIYNLCGPACTVRVVRTYIHVCPQHDTL
jgi:hypothetical protein